MSEPKLNRLPARTWNWLRMNESLLNLAPAEAGCMPAVSGLTEPAVWTADAPLPEGWNEIETGMGPDFDAYLNETALFALEVPEGAVLSRPVVLDFTYPEGTRLASRVYLHAEKNSVLPVILLLRGDAELAALQTRVRAEAGAKVTVYAVELLSEKAACLNDLGGICAEGASMELVKLELGAGQNYSGTAASLAGKGSQFRANVGYRVPTGRKLDMNYVIRHYGEKTHSQLDVNGVLEEDAAKLFRGTIDFPKGCKGAKGNEQETVLLLGERQVNQTIPLILCQEEDVEGNHGATIGRLEERVLFYLASRGISRKAAENMIARAKLDAVCGLIPSEEVRDLVWAFLGDEREEDDGE